MNNELPKVLIITGPTGIGKSSFAISLAQALKSEIINGDSVQVYKDFNIGAAKISQEEQQGVVHHMLSYVEPQDTFDAAKFVKDASRIIIDLNKKNILPIVCGGTGLYLRSLLCGMADVPEVTEQAKQELYNKEKLLDQANLAEGLHQWLTEIDYKAAENINKTDIQRIKRALLVYLSTGKSLITYQEEHKHKDLNFNALVLILKMDKELLNRRINSRVKEMLDLGLLEEVKALQSTYPLNSNAFNAIGYRHAVEFLRGDYGNGNQVYDKMAYEKMIELLKRDTKHFAKRQRTWWRNQPRFLGWEFLGEYFFNSSSLVLEADLKELDKVESKDILDCKALIKIISSYFTNEPKVSYVELKL